jgi:hypothetical protein
MSITRVVHCKREAYDVYIGRRANGETRSKSAKTARVCRS